MELGLTRWLAVPDSFRRLGCFRPASSRGMVLEQLPSGCLLTLRQVSPPYERLRGW